MLEIDKVTKVYNTRQGSRTILKEVCLTVQKGEKVGILGHNGAGKSTLIRLISGAEHPTRGVIRRGMSVSWPLAFGGTFQGSLTGLDNLKFICRIYNIDIQKILSFVEDFCELGIYFREPVKKYSAGMQARLAFGISMAVEFDCFLIDEIVAVGDSRFHLKCHHELFEKRHDRAMIIVSHHEGYIKEHCDRASVLVNGQLYHFETVNDAFAFYQHQQQAA
jgi:capsular polysaccharide transport system ATP-binding protein